MSNQSPEFSAEYQRIFALWKDDAMTGLTGAERDFILANVCLNQSLNGGLMMYYENSYGDRAHDALEVFERIGPPGAARSLARANRLMGESGPSRDQEERGDQLQALSDEALEEMGECSDALNAQAAGVWAATLRRVKEARRG